MNVFNNIWTEISTPNEILINLLMIIAIIIESFFALILFTSILNIKSTLKQKIFYISSVSIVGIFSMFFIPSPINLIFNYFFMGILTTLIFRLPVIKGVISTILPSILFALIGVLITNPYMTVLRISSDNLATIPIYRFFYLVIIYILISIVCVCIKHRNVVLEILEDIDLTSKIIIWSNLIFGVITLGIQIFITFYYVDVLPIFITFLSFISLLAYFSLSLYSLSRIFMLTLTKRKLACEEEYNRTLNILNDNIRSFKHDFDNIVTTIGGYVKTDDMNGLKHYYIQLEDDCQNVNTLYILNPKIVNNDGVYNLLSKKYNEAEAQDIKVNITFLLDLRTLNMKIYEFSRILGILLDNAIEASKECKDKIINIAFRDDAKNSRQIVTIENTYHDKNINTEKIFEKGVSGKENHTGLGLWEVRKLISKNNNINLHTSTNKEYFLQQLEIYY